GRRRRRAGVEGARRRRSSRTRRGEGAMSPAESVAAVQEPVARAEGAKPAIEVRDLVVRYGARPVLAGVSLDVPAGRVVALLGRNGEGKSSLVRCVAGLQRPEGGSVRVLGRDPWR